MLKDRLRVAVVQLTCHPAAVILHQNYLKEPFLPQGRGQDAPLKMLANDGVNVTSAQDTCKDAYVRWSKRRLEAVLDRLSKGFECICSDGERKEEPSAKILPDVVVFPEYAVPFEHLGVVGEFAEKAGSAVFAGTHALDEDLDQYRNEGFFDFENCIEKMRQEGKSVPSQLEEAKNTFGYKRLQAYAKSTLATKSVMPIFNVFFPNIETPFNVLLPKRILSIFEMTETGTPMDTVYGNIMSSGRSFELVTIRPRMHPIPESPKGQLWKTFSVLPLICSEALQFPLAHTANSPNLVVIVARNREAKAFGPEIARNSKNKIPVLFSNDGEFGGSSVSVESDTRIGRWWWSDKFNGTMESGDGVLLVDLAMGALDISSGHHLVEARLALASLSAVVSGNESSSPGRVAARLREIGNYPRQSRFEKLRELKESEVPTSLQKSKIDLLLQMEAVSPYEWTVFADDITYSFTAIEQEIDRSFGRLDVSVEDLKTLEKMLARYCLDVIRREHRRHHSDGTLAIDQARNMCSKYGEVRDSVNVERVVWEFFIATRKTAIEMATRQLTAVTADLVGRFGATAAWLYRCDPTNKTDGLRLEVTHNARLEPSRLEYGKGKGENSFAGYVATCRKGLIYRHIIHYGRHTIPREFMTIKSSTRSAMAAPIFADQAEKDMLGVIVLEANRPAAFMPQQLAELEGESIRLTHSLLVLRRAFEANPDYKLTWHPETTSWCISELLNSFCFRLASAVPDSGRVPGFGCTIWYNDETNREAFARGCVRFDHEYLTHGLPTRDEPGNAVSFVGSIITKQQTLCRPTHWHQIPSFTRSDKAEQRELREIIAAPIPSSDTSEEKLRKEYPGAMSFYFYDDEYGDGADRTCEQFDEQTVHRMCDILSRFLARAELTSTEVAGSLTRSRILTEAIRVDQGFDILRNMVLDLLGGEACSIFVAKYDAEGANWPSELHCVSTTGISDGEEAISLEDVIYKVGTREHLAKLLEDKQPRRFKGQRTLRCLITGWCRDNNMTSQGYTWDEAPQRFVESGGLDPNQGRRFLAVGIFDENQRMPLGVIRVLRAFHSRPFLEEDVKILKTMGNSVRQLFEQKALHEGEFRLRCAKAESLTKIVLANLHSRVRSDANVNRALTRLFGPLEIDAGWSKVRVASVLRDILIGLRPNGMFLVSLCTLVEQFPGTRQLELYACDSFGTARRVPPHVEPVKELIGANRWVAITRGCAIQTEGMDQHIFVGIDTIQESRFITGFCFPFILSFRGKPVISVISIDFDHDLNDNEAQGIVRTLFAATQKLNAIACGSVRHQPKQSRLHQTMAKSLEQEIRDGLDERQRFKYLTVWHYSQMVGTIKSAFAPLESQHLRSLDWIISPQTDCETPYDWFNTHKSDFHLDIHKVFQQLVDRSVLPPTSTEGRPPRRFFGQEPVECFDLFHNLSDLRVMIDLRQARFVIPLQTGFMTEGCCFGEFNKQDIENRTSERISIADRGDQYTQIRYRFIVIAEAILELHNLWCKHSVAFPSRHDSIVFAPHTQDSFKEWHLQPCRDDNASAQTQDPQLPEGVAGHAQQLASEPIEVEKSKPTQNTVPKESNR